MTKVDLTRAEKVELGDLWDIVRYRKDPISTWICVTRHSPRIVDGLLSKGMVAPYHETSKHLVVLTTLGAELASSFVASK